MANIVIYIRIACSIILLFCHALSPQFYTVYLTAAVTDVLGGAIARKTGTAVYIASDIEFD